ncbi:MAG: hypothetical protein R2795_23975 [Saprospiraceae bacterium]
MMEIFLCIQQGVQRQRLPSQEWQLWFGRIWDLMRIPQQFIHGSLKHQVTLYRAILYMDLAGWMLNKLYNDEKVFGLATAYPYCFYRTDQASVSRFKQRFAFLVGRLPNCHAYIAARFTGFALFSFRKAKEFFYSKAV